MSATCSLLVYVHLSATCSLLVYVHLSATCSLWVYVYLIATCSLLVYIHLSATCSLWVYVYLIATCSLLVYVHLIATCSLLVYVHSIDSSTLFYSRGIHLTSTGRIKPTSSFHAALLLSLLQKCSAVRRIGGALRPSVVRNKNLSSHVLRLREACWPSVVTHSIIQYNATRKHTLEIH